MNYTKGEWKAIGGMVYCDLSKDKTRLIATVGGEEWREAEANARLIAAAPDEDNALRLVVWDLDNLGKVSPLTRQVIDKALAKAKS